MQYRSELSLFMKLLKNSNLLCRLFEDPEHSGFELDFDLGLRRLLNPGGSYTEQMLQFLRSCEPNKIYRISDDFLCHYFAFWLPGTEKPSYILIGPYLLEHVTLQSMLDHASRFAIPPALFPQLEKYYQALTIVPDENSLLILVNTFGEHIWGSLDNIELQDVYNSVFFDLESVAEFSGTEEKEEPFLSMEILEERYGIENMLIQAVSQGQTHKAEMLLHTSAMSNYEQRITDPIRNIKNYMIILNTLLRKAAETEAVHPLNIDTLSSEFARKIERITSESSADALRYDMVRKYCLLVKNHSLKGYSLLIRKVLTRIEADLTTDLSLKALADHLNVNPSYLSTLFKKETGTTLTEYVNRKRIEHGILLLNTTCMQIQSIAQYCGIPDVNYFTKLFKKYIGKTPKEYRDDINTPSLTH